MRDLSTSPCTTEKRDRDELDRVLNRSIQPVRVVIRSLALRQLHAGKTVSEVAANVHLTSKAVLEIGRRYEDSGLERARSISASKSGGVVTAASNSSNRFRVLPVITIDSFRLGFHGLRQSGSRRLGLFWSRCK